MLHLSVACIQALSHSQFANTDWGKKKNGEPWTQANKQTKYYCRIWLWKGYLRMFSLPKIEASFRLVYLTNELYIITVYRQCYKESLKYFDVSVRRQLMTLSYLILNALIITSMYLVSFYFVFYLRRFPIGSS